jgi:hypothetical protein
MPTHVLCMLLYAGHKIHVCQHFLHIIMLGSQMFVHASLFFVCLWVLLRIWIWCPYIEYQDYQDFVIIWMREFDGVTVLTGDNQTIWLYML